MLSTLVDGFIASSSARAMKNIWNTAKYLPLHTVVVGLAKFNQSLVWSDAVGNRFFLRWNDITSHQHSAAGLNGINGINSDSFCDFPRNVFRITYLDSFLHEIR